MVAVNYAIAGDPQGAFSGDISGSDSIGMFKRCVKGVHYADNDSDGVHLRVFLARANGVWLQRGSSKLKSYATNKDAKDPIGEFFQMPAYFSIDQCIAPNGGSDVVHLVVKRTHDANNLIEQASRAINLHSGFRYHGEALLELSEVNWDDVSEVYLRILAGVDNLVQMLYDQRVRVDWNRDRTMQWSKRNLKRMVGDLLHLLARSFGCGVEVYRNFAVKRDQIEASGKLDFVLRISHISIANVQVEVMDLNKGLAQALLVMEIIAEKERLDVVWGVVTTFSTWVFLKKTGATTETQTVDFAFGDRDQVFSVAELERIMGYLYNILSDAKPPARK